VGLNGHVVMEAWYEGDWHLYDPDLEVLPVNSQGHVMSVEKLSHEKELLQSYYGPHGMMEIVGSLQDDNYVSTRSLLDSPGKPNFLVGLSQRSRS